MMWERSKRAKTTNLVPVSRNLSSTLLPHRASVIQTQVHFKNKTNDHHIKQELMALILMSNSQWPAPPNWERKAKCWPNRVTFQSSTIVLRESSFQIPITGAECQPGIKLWPLSQRQLTTQLVSGQLNLQSWIPAFQSSAEIYEQC